MGRRPSHVSLAQMSRTVRDSQQINVAYINKMTHPIRPPNACGMSACMRSMIAHLVCNACVCVYVEFSV